MKPGIILAILLVVFVGCTARTRPGKLLGEAPIWGRLLVAKDAEVQRQKLEKYAQQICETSQTTLRQALKEYLTAVQGDDLEVSYRIDNARIVCAMFFKVPVGHPFREFFDNSKPDEFKLILPDFLTTVNRGRAHGEDSIEQFLAEFDRLSGTKRRETPQQP